MNLSVDLSLYYLSQGSINNVVEKRGGFCGLELLSKTRLKSLLMHFWVSLWPALPFYLMLSNTKLLVWQGEIWISFISSIVVEKNFVLWSFGSYHLSLLWIVLSRLVLGVTVLCNTYFSFRSHLKFPSCAHWLLLETFIQKVFETNLNFRYQQASNKSEQVRALLICQF